MGARLALVIVGAIVLAGWPGLPRGQLGIGPKPPSLLALHGISMAALEDYADAVFNLRPPSDGLTSPPSKGSPPMLLRGGALRPLVLDGLASLIMYYQERFDHDEMLKVQAKLRECYVHLSLTPGQAP